MSKVFGNSDSNKEFIKKLEDYVNEHGYFSEAWLYYGLPEEKNEETEEALKWYKENKDLIGVIETLTERCKELEKKADLANADATNWEHKFFVESAKYDELIDKASELDLENAKLQRTVKKYKDEMNSLFLEANDMVSQRDNSILELETVEKELSSVKKELEKYKNEVRKLNAACKAKNVRIESLKKKLANKGIRIANNVIDPYCEVSYVFDNGYYRADEILEVHTNETD